ncbi:MAG: hypothetical protein ER33_01675 [Cyanobium sp. CACIAM 14]|nr:MAG: hypothetical protein ER33_01675 [Cyanobium sp. CACIAM 14]
MPALPRSCLPPLAGLLLIGGLGLAPGVPSGRADPVPALITLECRLADGPWQTCQMQVDQIGVHWFLLVAGERIEFRHNGRGSVTMLRPSGSWQPVSSRWEADTSLCWDGVCTRGDIPLD